MNRKQQKIKLLIDETRDKTPRRKTFGQRIVDLVVFCLIFGIIIATLVVFMNFAGMPAFTRHGNERILLDVTGLKWEEAKHLIMLEKFTPVRAKSIARDDVEPFTVLKQMPRPGSRVKLGRRVYLDISVPLQNVEFPDLKGKTMRSAQILLDEINIKVDSVSYGFSDLPREVIFWQSIEPDELIRPGSSVHIKISLGLSNWTVPETSGMSLQEARKKISDAGLRIGTVNYQERNDLLPNTVIYQSIPGNTVMTVPQPVDLIVSQLSEESNTENSEGGYDF